MPSTSNLQAYSVVSVQDAERRRKIAELAGRQGFIRDAGMFLVVCADLHRTQRAADVAGHDFYQKQFFESTLVASIDAALFGAAATIVAETLGYGTCMIGAIRNHADRVVELLALPEKVYPVFGLCIGHAKLRNPPKPRIPLTGIVFDDAYDEQSMRAGVQSYDREMAASGIYEGREYPLDGIPNAPRDRAAAAAYGWIEHTARRVSTRDPEKTRQELRRILEAQNFRFE
jgi:FMN reductase (NADPH)